MIDVIANRYAEALFQIGEEENKTDNLYNELKEVSSLITTNNELNNVMKSPLVSKKEKIQLIDTLFAGKIDNDLKNFLKILIEKGRITSISAIEATYKGLLNEKNNILEGYVISAVPMDNEKIKELETELSKKYNKNVIKVNNSVILPKGDYSNKQKHNPMRLLFVGRLSRIKGVDKIIKAVEGEENIELTIVGDGEERDYLESLVKTSKISFKGAQKPDQVKNEMIYSDILVMNSILEGKPMTIIEAMSYGMPIVTTNVGGISELVRFGENAEKTDGTSQSIIAAIKKIQLNYEGYSQKSVRISSEFDYKKVNLIIFDRIKKLC